MELSADERKRLEYEARDKALRDYNSNMKGSYDRGHAAGFEEGLRKAHDRELATFLNLLNRNFSVEDAKTITYCSDDIVQEALVLRDKT
ncbi:MAG: hypothetical protein LUD53_05600 [Clostridiales bacterium]|nr:hypothetical protein [Clostridiales bacterium]